jgi:sec-independent protein translocase protein TatB
MLNLDPGKLLVIAVVAVILLGPDKLPQVARQVGAAWRSFGEFRHRMETEVRSSIPDLPSSAEIARLARSPQALLNHLSNMGPEGAVAGAAAAAGVAGAAVVAAGTGGADGADGADGTDGALGTDDNPDTHAAADPNSADTNTPNVTIEATTEPSPFEPTTPTTTRQHQNDVGSTIVTGDPSLN